MRTLGHAQSMLHRDFIGSRWIFAKKAGDVFHGDCMMFKSEKVGGRRNFYSIHFGLVLHSKYFLFQLFYERMA